MTLLPRQIRSLGRGAALEAERLKQQFLQQQPELDPRVQPFWEKYQRAFSLEHMDDTPDQVFKDFGNSPIGAYAG